METTVVQNPILPGFYSDPSVCRVGGEFYLVTSSFEFFPGVPLFHSTDLINWTQLGHCLTRPGQLELSRCGVSDGIFAPTLRYHGGRFYMITSNRSAGGGNHFFVYTDDICGEWSDPVWITAPDGSYPDGVDPSLFFDEDGGVYFSCVAWDERGQGIGQAQVNLATGRLAAPLRIVWHGTGGTFPEGPHTYRIGGWYYLMVAEGGTEFGHKVVLARARDIWGPYEPCPHNPVLSQIWQHAQSQEIQGVGHGDLIQAENGGWWMIVHGFRTSIGKLHHLGRESLLVPVEWDRQGWPVANGKGWLEETVTVSPPVPGARQLPRPIQRDDFSAGLPLHYHTLRGPIPQGYSLTQRPGWLVLHGGTTTLNDLGSPVWVGRRQQDFDCVASVELSYTPAAENEEAGLTVYQTTEHHYDLAIRRRDGKTRAFLRRVVGDLEVAGPAVELEGDTWTLEIRASRSEYRFAIEGSGGRRELGSGRTQLLSTEAMQYQNFTGTFFAMYAVDGGNGASPSAFRGFAYRPCQEDAPPVANC